MAGITLDGRASVLSRPPTQQTLLKYDVILLKQGLIRDKPGVRRRDGPAHATRRRRRVETCLIPQQLPAPRARWAMPTPPHAARGCEG